MIFMHTLIIWFANNLTHLTSDFDKFHIALARIRAVNIYQSYYNIKECTVSLYFFPDADLIPLYCGPFLTPGKLPQRVLVATMAMDPMVCLKLKMI